MFVISEGMRAIFNNATGGLHVDVFYEKLVFCHDINLNGRLEADAPKARLRISPMKTSLFQRLEVTGLHFQGERISFVVTGDRVKMGPVPKGIKVQT